VKRILLSFALLLATPCFAHHMAVVVSKDNAVDRVSSAQLSKIFRGETRKWPDGRMIVLVIHRASPGESITLQHLNKMTATQFQAWIIEHRDSLKMVDSDEDVLSIVETDPEAVGLVDVRSLTDRVKLVHVDGKVPMEDGYLPH
jgi:ABC-type phosphate transport system substrate-binding protein